MKEPPTTPDGLAAWQARLGLNSTEAARRLALTYRGYRQMLPGGRRRRDGLPGWITLLCAYVERDVDEEREAAQVPADAPDLTAASRDLATECLTTRT